VFYSACYAVGLVSAKTDAQAVGVGLMNHSWPILTVVFAVFVVPGTRWSARLGVALSLALTGLLFANGDALARARGGAAALPYVLGGLAGLSWALYSALIARWGLLLLGAALIAAAVVVNSMRSGRPEREP